MQFTRTKQPQTTPVVFNRTVEPKPTIVLMNKNALTIRQRAFVENMANVDINGECPLTQSQAAINAGYSPNGVHVIASNLMSDPRIRKAIDDRIAKKFKRFDITPDAVLQELAALAFSDKADFYDEEGKLRSITDLPRHVSAALAGVEVQMTVDDLGHPAVVQKIKLHDKTKPLELLGKVFKLFTEKLEIAGNTQGTITQTNDERARESQRKLLAQLEVEEQIDQEVDRIVQENQ